MPKLTLVLDSSQISTLYDCEERWRLSQQETLIRIDPYNPTETLRPPDAISAGLLFHTLLEIYYRELCLTTDPSRAAQTALDFDPDKADVQDNHEYPIDPDMRKKVYNRFTDYLMCWGNRDYTVGHKLKSIIDVDPTTGFPIETTQTIPLVEQGFSFPLLDTSEYLFVLEGRIDFIGTCGGQFLWMDHKTQGRKHNLYKKSIQFKNYALATGFDMGVINYIRLTDKIDKETLVRDPISFSPHEMLAWKQELIEKYVEWARKISRGELQRNRAACGSEFGPCQFTAICEEYNPTMREQIKRGKFMQRKVWKPW